MGQHQPAVWLGFSVLVAALLALDLGVLNRRAHTLGFREALRWSASVVALALLFGGFVFWREGGRSALEYYTGYLIELSLSVDNLFVFILIFAYFGVPAEARPKVLKGRPAAHVTPANGNYVYLESDPGDFVGQGRAYLYVPATAVLNVSASAGLLSVGVNGDERWYGRFQ